jgi:multicomponent Na+:H+ antiporter subunit D
LSSASRPRSGGTDEALAEAEAGALSRRLGAELLRVAIALALAVTSLELLIGLADVVAGQPFGVGAAALALAFAVALRMGFVPVHGHAARLARHASRAAVPVLSLWGPALFALAALAAFEAAVVPLGLPLSIERGVIAGLAILTIVAGGVGALVQDDIDHVVAYSILQDSGVVLLAFAAADSAAWAAARTWLLVLPVTKTALLAWSLTTGRTFGTRSLLELRGWARRAPLLGISLALVTLATIGLPGLASFDARLTLVRGALAEPVRVVVLLASLSSVIVVARMLVVGVDRPMALVDAAPDERLRRPPSDLRRRVGRTMRQTVDLNRAPLSAALVLGLALVASGVGAGLFGLRSAASEDRPAALPGPQPTTVPGPTFQPVATEAPSIVPGASAS